LLCWLLLKLRLMMLRFDELGEVGCWAWPLQLGILYSQTLHFPGKDIQIWPGRSGRLPRRSGLYWLKLLLILIAALWLLVPRPWPGSLLIISVKLRRRTLLPVVSVVTLIPMLVARVRERLN
jgi:hypothetical protein